MTLALGIGATAVLFSILDGAYIRFGQTEQANRAVLLTQRFTKLNSDTALFSPAEYFDIAGLHESFDGFFALSHFNPIFTDTGGQVENPERVPAIRATANIFQLYGIAPIVGRVFTTAEDTPGGSNIAVLTYRLWNRRFGRNPAVIGRIIQLDGVSYTIIGITPRRFQQWGADILIPLRLDSAASNRAERTLTVAGIPKRGVSPSQTEKELQVLARRVEGEYGGANPEYAGLLYLPIDIRSAVVGDLRTALYIPAGCRCPASSDRCDQYRELAASTRHVARWRNRSTPCAGSHTCPRNTASSWLKVSHWPPSRACWGLRSG